MKRVLLGYFLRGADPPAVCQGASTHLSGCQNLCPYGRYWPPGTGEEARGVEQAVSGAQGMAEEGGGEQGEVPGTAGELR